MSPDLRLVLAVSLAFWSLCGLLRYVWLGWVGRDRKPSLSAQVETQIKAEILAAYEQRAAQQLGELLHQRTCILAYQRGEKQWRS